MIMALSLATPFVKLLKVEEEVSQRALLFSLIFYERIIRL
tara:strand:+ start:143 stop:262 length:120 start_codon:yes stop_codon:yes gene_type:complete